MSHSPHHFRGCAPHPGCSYGRRYTFLPGRRFATVTRGISQSPATDGTSRTSCTSCTTTTPAAPSRRRASGARNSSPERRRLP